MLEDTTVWSQPSAWSCTIQDNSNPWNPDSKYSNETKLTSWQKLSNRDNVLKCSRTSKKVESGRDKPRSDINTSVAVKSNTKASQLQTKRRTSSQFISCKPIYDAFEEAQSSWNPSWEKFTRERKEEPSLRRDKLKTWEIIFSKEATIDSSSKEKR